MSFLLKVMCKHLREDLSIRTTNYNTLTFTCTKIDHEIICNYCGKILVSKNDFDGLKELLTGTK